jgi:membrane-associated phospholipid phosphatase
MRIFHPCLTAALAALLAFQALPAVADGNEYTGDELAADIVTAALPLGAFAIAHYKDDGAGEGQFFRVNAANLVLNTALRVAFNETEYGERPNGNQYAFPSGHVGFVITQAAFLQQRFGWKYGAPAYLLSGYVAWVRVDTDHHHWRDVVFAVALSEAMARLFVTPHDAVTLAPIVGPEWLGLRIGRSF